MWSPNRTVEVREPLHTSVLAFNHVSSQNGSFYTAYAYLDGPRVHSICLSVLVVMLYLDLLGFCDHNYVLTPHPQVFTTVQHSQPSYL